ncbi:hypothetical protein SEVIR_2G259732v4 [Setaria viridis]
MSSDQKEERNKKKREISDDKREATNKKRREISDERREELNRKRHDQYKMKKGREDNKQNVPSNDQDDVNGGLPIHSSDVEVGEHNDKHDEMHDWLHRNHLYGPPISESCDLSNQIPGSGDNGEIVDLTDTIPQDTPVVDPKECRRLQARALRVALTPDQRDLNNQHRREAYHANKKAKAQLSDQQRLENSRESKRKYKRNMKEFRENVLHPDSIAMESPNLTLGLYSLLKMILQLGLAS